MLLLLSLILFISKSDWTDIYANIKSVGHKFWLIILVSGLAYFLGTLAWRLCISREYRTTSIVKLFIIRLIGENIAVINPTNLIGGEGSKAYLLEKTGVPYKVGMASLILSRTLVITSQIFLFFLTSAIIFFLSDRVMDEFWNVIKFILLSILIIIVVIRLVIRFRLGKRLFGKFSDRFTKLKSFLGNVKVELSRFYRYEKRSLIIAFILSAVHWMVGAMEIYVIFYAFGYDLTVLEAIFMDMGIVILKSFGAFVPGQIGVEEYANKLLMLAIGYSQISLWLGLSVLRRTRQLFWMLIGLILYFLFFRNKFSSYGNTVHHS